MTIAEAEEYYKRYLGHGFHMCREEPGRYEYFRRLDLPEEVLAKWDADLLERELEMMMTDERKRWSRQGNVIDILMRGKCDREAGAVRLLDGMERLELPLWERTLIVENMAGRSAKLTDGGVYLICMKTKQGERMKRIMEERFLPDPTGDVRHKEAVRKYGEAMRRFARK